MEFFWLCGECAREHIISHDQIRGILVVINKNSGLSRIIESRSQRFVAGPQIAIAHSA